MGLIGHILGQRGLSDDEQKLIRLLLLKPMKQKELLKKSGMNSVKFNKVLRSLEEQKIAKREPRGRENMVRLL